MCPRIAIPVPASDEEYSGRSLPPYVAALEAVGATAVVIDLSLPRQKIAELLSSVHGVLLPGSRYDVDPARYGEVRRPECGEIDNIRTAVDELLLEDAFRIKKPVLAICHGAQALNVWRGGSLFQDLQSDLNTPVNHRPGRTVVDAHPVKVRAGSRLAALLPAGAGLETQVNSSHHQAIRVAGGDLRVSAVSPEDGVVEGVELSSAEHFVMGVQWHPERTLAESGVSRSIFGAFVEASETWQESGVNDGSAAR